MNKIIEIVKNTDLLIILQVLIVVWIIISLIKNNMNKDGINRYNFIQKNTIMYWILIIGSLYLSKSYFNNYWYSIVIFIVIFSIHEILWYKFFITFFIDEGELTENWYSNANIYVDTIKDIDNLQGTDFSEGIFDNNWNLTNNEALNLKYKTYYEYLKLEPGMKLLDIGCGNGHWIKYCTKKGIKCTGITISKSQGDFIHNNNKDINIIVGDIKHNILETISDKFDAISAIGPVEHFSSVSEPLNKRLNTLNKYYTQVKNLIKKNSKSRMYLNSYMTMNAKYTKYENIYWYYQIYLISRAFGYGYYASDDKMKKIYNSKKSQINIKRDYTEDYRWIFVRDKNTVGYVNYKINTPQRLFYTILEILTNPYWLQYFLYGYNDSWLWQFGGTQKTPMPEKKDTPIRSYIYVTKIN